MTSISPKAPNPSKVSSPTSLNPILITQPATTTRTTSSTGTTPSAQELEFVASIAKVKLYIQRLAQRTGSPSAQELLELSNLIDNLKNLDSSQVPAVSQNLQTSSSLKNSLTSSIPQNLHASGSFKDSPVTSMSLNYTGNYVTSALTNMTGLTPFVWNTDPNSTGSAASPLIVSSNASSLISQLNPNIVLAVDGPAQFTNTISANTIIAPSGQLVLQQTGGGPSVYGGSSFIIQNVANGNGCMIRNDNTGLDLVEMIFSSTASSTQAGLRFEHRGSYVNTQNTALGELQFRVGDQVGLAVGNGIVVFNGNLQVNGNLTVNGTSNTGSGGSSSGGAFSANNPGFTTLPGGVIMQWTAVTVPAGTTSGTQIPQTFATPFPNQIFGVQLTLNDPDYGNSVAPITAMGVAAISTTEVLVQYKSSQSPCAGNLTVWVLAYGM